MGYLNTLTVHALLNNRDEEQHSKETMTMSNRSEQSNESEDSNASIDPNVVVYTADEVLRAGLVVLKYTSKGIKRAKRKTNIERFKHHFGCPPLVAALIWEDLQTTAVPEAYLPPPKAKLQHFLMAFGRLELFIGRLDYLVDGSRFPVLFSGRFSVSGFI